MVRVRSSRGLKVGSIALVVLAVVVLAAALFLHGTRDATTAVSAHAAARMVGAKAAPEAVKPGLRPAAGTYAYVGGGSEHINLLGGSTHHFPSHVSGIVQLDAQHGCAWQLDMVLVKEHTERRNYCTNATGTIDAGFSRTTSFLGHQQTSTYACDRQAMRARLNAKVGEQWSWACTEARGGVVHFTATNIGVETIAIGGTQVRADHVRLVGAQHDKSTGDEHGDWWLLPSGLPVRMHSERHMVSSAGPLGTMTNSEQYRYELAALHATPIDAS